MRRIITFTVIMWAFHFRPLGHRAFRLGSRYAFSTCQRGCSSVLRSIDKLLPQLSLKSLKKIDGRHSTECLTHAGHSITFNMFSHFVACDLDLLTVFVLSCRQTVKQTNDDRITNTQTNRQTRMTAILTRPVAVSNYLNPLKMSTQFVAM